MFGNFRLSESIDAHLIAFESIQKLIYVWSKKNQRENSSIRKAVQRGSGLKKVGQSFDEENHKTLEI